MKLNLTLKANRLVRENKNNNLLRALRVCRLFDKYYLKKHKFYLNKKPRLIINRGIHL